MKYFINKLMYWFQNHGFTTFDSIWLYIVWAILGAQGPRYLFSRATKERGRTQFEGLGPQYRSYNTQFYNIEAFSSQKGDKTFVFLNFPRFPRNFRKKSWRRKKIGSLILANREKGHKRSFGTAIRIQLSRPNRDRFRPEKGAFVWNRRRGSDLEQSPDL